MTHIFNTVETYNFVAHAQVLVIKIRQQIKDKKLEFISALRSPGSHLPRPNSPKIPKVPRSRHRVGYVTGMVTAVPAPVPVPVRYVTGTRA